MTELFWEQYRALFRFLRYVFVILNKLKSESRSDYDLDFQSISNPNNGKKKPFNLVPNIEANTLWNHNELL